jgi:histidinol-phosphate phosphatase family protein
LNGAGWLVASVTNQPAIAKGFMAEQDLEKVHRRLERLLGEAGAWLDDLEHCPHHPEKGHSGERPELKLECDCRKPSAGMLERIVARRTVDLRRSVIIGDSWRDMVAGHAMGLDAIGVMTGHALRNSPPAEFWTSGRPDVVAEDLSQAVSLLLDEDPAIAAILERVDACASSSSPLCILIGGLARSGKSTTAFRLRRALRERGSEALCVRLDDWLLPASERPEGSVLLQRYRVDELTRDLCQLAAGEPVLAPGYDARTRESAPLPVSYDPAGVDVVIAEGVPATLLDLRRAGVLWVQVEAPDEEERRNRLLRFYRFKGFSEEETERMLAAREEEHATVSQAGEGADLRITPSSLRSDSIGDASR